MATKDAPRKSRHVVVFSIGSLSYGVEIQHVREVIAPLALIEIPKTSYGVVGVAEYRGEVLPVVNVRARLGFDDAEFAASTVQRTAQKKPKWIIVSRSGQLVALAVDAVLDVFEATAAQARSLPEVGPDGPPVGVIDVYSDKGNMIFIVDLEQIASTNDVESIIS